MNHVLLINMARLGDIIQSFPALERIKDSRQDVRITCMVNSRFAQGCDLISQIDNVLVVDFKKIRDNYFSEPHGLEYTYEYLYYFFKELNRSQTDSVINITPHYIGLYSAYLAGDRQGLKSSVTDWMRYYIAATRSWKMLPMHLSDLFSLIAGHAPYPVKTGLHISDAAQRWADGFYRTSKIAPDDTVIGIHAGASTRDKTWPEENFITLIQALAEKTDARILLVGSGDAGRLANECSDYSNRRVVNATNRTDIMQLAALVNRMSVLITNDSGPMHIAAYCGTRVISIHTGKEKLFSTGPYGTGHICFMPRFPCYPCEHPERCSSQRCRWAIPPEAVFNAALSLAYCSGNIYSAKTRSYAGDTFAAYTSAFDHNGFMDYYPLSKAGLPQSELIMRFMRIMWNIAFENSSSPQRSACDTIRQQTGELLKMLIRYYDAESLAHLNKAWENIAAYLNALNGYACEGTAAADTIAAHAKCASPQLQALEEMSTVIEHIDYRILSHGETQPDCAMISRMFSFEKEKLEGETLADMAMHTRSIYEQLAKRCSILQRLGDEFFEMLEPLLRADQKVINI